MQIIKLNATDSTNNYLKQLMLETALDDFSVVVTLITKPKAKGKWGAEWILKKIKT